MIKKPKLKPKVRQKRFVVDSPIEPKFPNIHLSLNDSKKDEEFDVELIINGSVLCKLTIDGYLTLCHMDDNLKMLGFKVDEKGYIKIKQEKP